VEGFSARLSLSGSPLRPVPYGTSGTSFTADAFSRRSRCSSAGMVARWLVRSEARSTLSGRTPRKDLLARYVGVAGVLCQLSQHLQIER